jgi:hypothetical protein
MIDGFKAMGRFGTVILIWALTAEAREGDVQLRLPRARLDRKVFDDNDIDPRMLWAALFAKPVARENPQVIVLLQFPGIILWSDNLTTGGPPFHLGRVKTSQFLDALELRWESELKPLGYDMFEPLENHTTLFLQSDYTGALLRMRNSDSFYGQQYQEAGPPFQLFKRSLVSLIKKANDTTDVTATFHWEWVTIHTKPDKLIFSLEVQPAPSNSWKNPKWQLVLKQDDKPVSPLFSDVDSLIAHVKESLPQKATIHWSRSCIPTPGDALESKESFAKFKKACEEIGINLMTYKSP